MTVQEPESPVEVTVEVTVPEPETVTPEVPAVVVVEPEPDAVPEVVVETAIDHEGRIAVIESRLDRIEQNAAEALSLADTALTVAVQEPIEEPIVELAPEPEPEPVEPDIAPDNEHWFFKKGWF